MLRDDPFDGRVRAPLGRRLAHADRELDLRAGLRGLDEGPPPTPRLHPHSHLAHPVSFPPISSPLSPTPFYPQNGHMTVAPTAGVLAPPLDSRAGIRCSSCDSWADPREPFCAHCGSRVAV